MDSRWARDFRREITPETADGQKLYGNGYDQTFSVNPKERVNLYDGAGSRSLRRSPLLGSACSSQASPLRSP